MDVNLGNRSSISPDMISRFSKDFKEQKHYKVMANAIKKNGINDVAMNQDSPVLMKHTFSEEIQSGKITNQKKSGRCWLFAALNTLRQQIAEKCNLEHFELSQNHLTFWDKFEKANYFLESILETLNEETSSRLISWLLSNPVQDGGQWDMFVNLIEKYGVVPKQAMPETYHSNDSRMMNRLLTVKLREGAAYLRTLHRERKMSEDDLRVYKESLLNDIYRMLCHFLGEPPANFDFEFRDKDGNFVREAHLTPEQFYKNYVSIHLSDYVSLIHAPTSDKPYGRTYTVRYLGNVKEGKDVLYLNVEIETLKKLALAQLRNDEPVWFGCDVGQMMERKSGIMDMDLFDYESALDVKFNMTKSQRLEYSESLMTHAMVLKGVNLVDGVPNRWKVENSWGKENGEDGFFVMGDSWFDEFVYQIVVNRNSLPEELRQALGQTPVQLDPWDPMGSLA